MRKLAWSSLSRLQVPKIRRVRVTPFEKSILGRKCDWLHCDLISAGHSPKQLPGQSRSTYQYPPLLQRRMQILQSNRTIQPTNGEERGDGDTQQSTGYKTRDAARI